MGEGERRRLEVARRRRQRLFTEGATGRFRRARLGGYRPLASGGSTGGKPSAAGDAGVAGASSDDGGDGGGGGGGRAATRRGWSMAPVEASMLLLAQGLLAGVAGAPVMLQV